MTRLPYLMTRLPYFKTFIQNNSNLEVSPQCRRVAILVGRRPDAPKAATRRFPLENTDTVKGSIMDVLSSGGFTTLVCSAACGADLLALDAANELGLEIYILLPFAPSVFRKLSVTDRPGKWGASFNRVIKQAREAGTLEVLAYDPDDDNAFFDTNKAIVSRAEGLADGEPITGILVWDGKSRGSDDATQQFADLCKKKGFHRVEISTL